MPACVPLQFSLFLLVAVQLMPTSPVAEEVSRGKSRKRVNPVVHTEPPEPDPIAEAYRYCNLPNQTEHTWEGPPQDHHRAGMMWVVEHSQHCSDTDVVVVC
ncbi:hypothetical protein NFI96_001751 [Prochilodus magdalenae]|nr:hypothetical protein NFI96_001751 [Prochilodus magdalenae]